MNKKQHKKRRRNTQIRVPLVLIVPGLIFALAGHFIAPFIGAFYAFTDFKGLGSYNFIGFDNFIELFQSTSDLRALTNTFKLAIPFVLLVIVLGLALAMALHAKLKTRNVLRSILFVPAVMIPLAITQVWKYILNFDGPLNSFLTSIGQDSLKTNWLGDIDFALWCILLVMVWQYMGYAMVIFNAGLQAIPEELNEAASIDGANWFTRFRHITLPMLAPSFTVVIVLMTINGLRVFDQVVGLTGGGPAGWTETLASAFYKQTWVNGRYGYGTALALILTLLVSIIGVLQATVLSKREDKVNG